jgi:hypothetical protein
VVHWGVAELSPGKGQEGLEGAITSNGGMMERNSEKVSQIVQIMVAVPLAVVLAIWTIWITVTAFIGGQAPWFFIDFSGVNPIRGFLWLVIVDPIVVTVAYWIFMLALLPVLAFSAIFGRSSK